MRARWKQAFGIAAILLGLSCTAVSDEPEDEFISEEAPIDGTQQAIVNGSTGATGWPTQRMLGLVTIRSASWTRSGVMLGPRFALTTYGEAPTSVHFNPAGTTSELVPESTSSVRNSWQCPEV